MKKENALAYIPLIEAFAEGRLEFKPFGGTWTLLETTDFSANVDDYRIKIRPEYIPLNSKNCPIGATVRHKINTASHIITSVYNNECTIGSCVVSYAELLHLYVFADGSPCGALKK